MIKFIKSLFKKQEKKNAQIVLEKGDFKMYQNGNLVMHRVNKSINNTR